MSYGRYIKLPVEVQAMRYFKSRDMVDGLLAFCNRDEKIASYVIPHGGLDFDDGILVLRTREGGIYPNPGDWIIRGAQGEYYACKHEIFRQDYQESSDG